MNLYRYAGGDPVNITDPRGLCNIDPFSGSFWTEGNCLSEHPAEVAAGVGVGACIFASLGACAGATLAVFGTATWQNAEHERCGDFWSKEGLTIGLTAVGAGPGLIFGGLKAAGAIGDSVLPSSKLGTWGLNAYLTGPSAGAAAAEAGAGAASAGAGAAAGAGAGAAAGGAGASSGSGGGCE